jgi:hypothetical protein
MQMLGIADPPTGTVCMAIQSQGVCKRATANYTWCDEHQPENVGLWLQNQRKTRSYELPEDFRIGGALESLVPRVCAFFDGALDDNQNWNMSQWECALDTALNQTRDITSRSSPTDFQLAAVRFDTFTGKNWTNVIRTISKHQKMVNLLRTLIHNVDMIMVQLLSTNWAYEDILTRFVCDSVQSANLFQWHLAGVYWESKLVYATLHLGSQPTVPRQFDVFMEHVRKAPVIRAVLSNVLHLQWMHSFVQKEPEFVPHHVCHFVLQESIINNAPSHIQQFLDFLMSVQHHNDTSQIQMVQKATSVPIDQQTILSGYTTYITCDKVQSTYGRSSFSIGGKSMLLDDVFRPFVGGKTVIESQLWMAHSLTQMSPTVI